jgi:hypothetical protein
MITEQRKASLRAYEKRPEIKEKRNARARVRGQRPEVKKHHREYALAYSHRPGVAEKLRLRRQQPEFKAREKARRETPEAKAKAKAYQLYRNYGITWDERETMIASQGSVCAVCGSTAWGHYGPLVDHDHDTGEVRGIVCHKCNIGIGLIGDNLRRAEAVVAYLKKPRNRRKS